MKTGKYSGLHVMLYSLQCRLINADYVVVDDTELCRSV